MGSESGVLPIPRTKIVKKWRLQPGKMFLIDLEQGRMIDDEELKASSPTAKPYKQWIENVRIRLDDRGGRRTRQRAEPCGEPAGPPAGLRLHPGRHQVPAGTHGQAGEEAIGSMGNDSPLAVLSTRTSRSTTTSSSCSRR
jgi:glutamate synthase (NADPH/NADH) large chain